MTDLSPDARQLLRIVRDGDGATPSDRERVKARLGPVLASALAAGAISAAAGSAVAGAGGAAATGLAGTAGGAGAAVAAKLTIAQVVLWVALGSGAGLVGTVIATKGGLVSPDAPASASIRTGNAGASPSRPLGVGRPEPATSRLAASAAPPSSTGRQSEVAVGQEASGIEPGTEPEKRRPEGVASTGALSAIEVRGAEEPGSALAEEARRLQSAQRALRSGDERRAMELLNAHARDYPEGALGVERRALQITILCRQGRVGEARRLGRAVLEAGGGSTLVSKLLDACGGESP